jgi:hypothetical protein
MTAEVLGCGTCPVGAPPLLVRLSFGLAAVIAAAALAPGAHGSGRSDIGGDVLAARLSTGPVSLSGYRVHGDVNVDARTVKHEFVCHDCEFDGDIDASGTFFRRLVDLSGSKIAGNASMAGAVFEQKLLAAATTFDGTTDLRECVALGAVDMSGAIFHGPALFGLPPAGRPSFHGRVDFSLATFSQLATFESATFATSVDFTLARFDGDAIFAGGESNGRSTYERTIFSGLVDFSERTFNSAVNFEAAEFRDDADFSQALFNGPASFRAVRFGADASFFGAQFFDIASPDQESTFERIRAKGKLDFGLAVFERPTSFAQSSSSATLSFAGTDLRSVPHGIDLHDISVGSFGMSVGSASNAVRDGSGRDREHVLDLIESSAQAVGNLGLANEAHYKRQVLRSEHYSWPLHALDFVFYRLVAGYFVRPINPLLALLAIAAVITLVRVYRRHRTSNIEVRHSWSARTAERSRALARRTPRVISSFPGEFAAALGSVVPWGRGPDGRPARRVEAILYRVVLACAFIGLANSNPTLRQMFDALS